MSFGHSVCRVCLGEGLVWSRLEGNVLGFFFSGPSAFWEPLTKVRTCALLSTSYGHIHAHILSEDMKGSESSWMTSCNEVNRNQCSCTEKPTLCVSEQSTVQTAIKSETDFHSQHARWVADDTAYTRSFSISMFRWTTQDHWFRVKTTAK